MSYLDTDCDVVPNYVETIFQPNNGQPATDENDGTDFIDTDTGGTPDYAETIFLTNAGLSPTNPSAIADDANDSDNDGVPNNVEIGDCDGNPGDPTVFPDDDGDGVPNFVEINENTDPNDPLNYLDTDCDGVPDYVETVFQPNSGQPVTDH